MFSIEGQTSVTREQFYMMAQKRSNEKPPQLPPRDTSIYSHDLPTVSVCSLFFLRYYYYLCILQFVHLDLRFYCVQRLFSFAIFFLFILTK